jgi:Holliday junction DNA helicase RuvA
VGKILIRQGDLPPGEDGQLLAYLRGALVAIEKETVIIEINGLGFQLQVPVSTLKCLPDVGGEIKLHTFLVRRENELSLYGFWRQDERDVFSALLNVGGVGPKAAIGLLSALGPQKLSLAIVQEDVGTLTKAPGIGKKTAQRIILELKDKLTRYIVPGEALGEKVSSEEEDAAAALVALGYYESEARKTIRMLSGGSGATLPAAQLVRLALKKLGKNL